MPRNSKRKRRSYTPPLDTLINKCKSLRQRSTSRQHTRPKTRSGSRTRHRYHHTRHGDTRSRTRSRTRRRSRSRRSDRYARREDSHSRTRSRTQRRSRSRHSDRHARREDSQSRTRSVTKSRSGSRNTEHRGRRSRSRTRSSKDRQRSTRRYVRSPGFRDDRTTVQQLIDAFKSHGTGPYPNMQNIIPAFDPSTRAQTTKTWLRKVNETAKVYKWTESQTIYHAIPKLSGVAKQWYEGLSTSNLTWETWQKKLLQCFPDDMNYADRLIEMIDRRSKRDETLEQYFFDKAKLVAHCNIKGKDAVDCIIQGIYDNNIRLNAQGCDFKHTDKLLRYLRNVSAKNVRDAKKPIPHPKVADAKATGNSKFTQFDANKLGVYVKVNTMIEGTKTVEVYCDPEYTGYLYIPGNSSFKTGEEVIVLQGVY
ncbi:uncharacterized protein LOC134747387 [Cydia strobilella]|uniref:uncharacterized protein LOC134747387 n=1 Tax=Cydia strobilella TaxID=1100964 RepID=UPI003006FEA6